MKLAPVKAFFAGNKLYFYGAIALGVIVLMSGCYVAVTHAYKSIYDSGFQSGVLNTEHKYQAAIIDGQAKQLKLQQTIMAQTERYDSLFELYRMAEQKAPAEVIKYVRQDPAFAASQRPVDLHALRVRELQSLREAAATH